jgi:hypothetical protein
MIRIRLRRSYGELIWGLIFGTLAFCVALARAGLNP